MQKNSDKKTESQVVGEKVSKTKKEIEELKTQLQKLISQGLKKPEPFPVVELPSIKEKPLKSVKHTPNIQNPPEKSPLKKICNYDKEAAREFIKKQREKRKELLKVKRSKVDLTEDLKKQRLQELRQKSLQLLSKSIKKKREPVLLCEPSKPEVQTVEPLKFAHPVLKNITVRSPDFDIVPITPLQTLPDHTITNKAAVTIQAAFRGHQQRKLYRAMLKNRPISKEVQTHNPVWLKTPSLPHPYNFINAVKRKLNLAVGQAGRTNNVDASVQAERIDLKSFLSHKLLTVNSDKRLAVNSLHDESDSDTSKNVPDLSSESCVSSNKRAHSSDNLKISTDIKKLKLREANHSIIASNKCHYSKHSETNLKLPVEFERDVSQSSLLVQKGSKPTLKPSDLEFSSIATKLTSITEYSNQFDSASLKHIEPEYSSHFNSDSSKKLVDAELALKQSTATLQKNEVKTASEYLTHVGSSTSSIKRSDFIFDERLNDASRPNRQSSDSGVTSNRFSGKQSPVLLLKAPSISLKSGNDTNSGSVFSVDAIRRSDSIRTVKTVSESSHSCKVKGDSSECDENNVNRNKAGERTTVSTEVKSNAIHLKFEAELHLLNEFNDSLRRVMAIEKSLVELNNNPTSKTSFETRETQTSIITKTTMSSSQIPSINYSRGDFIDQTNETSFITSDLDISDIPDSLDNTKENNESMLPLMKDKLKNFNIHAGLSLEMFERLIKDEDARIENLKAILKIREKSLVDRTKGELAWLEVQKRHLRDSGQLQEISVIKKKQRGLLIKLEHERHEMQRLKQMQKAASKERKIALKEQRNNMIKGQLSTSGMSTKIKRNTKEYKRASGPLKVYNIKSHSESIVTETSFSRRSSLGEEINSVKSHSQSIVSHIMEEAVEQSIRIEEENVASVIVKPPVETECVKRSLLMREAALQKRRKAAEELLQWHQRLLEEEEKIAQLELAAIAIINQIPAVSKNSKHKFKGSQLNVLWHNMTGRDENKFNDNVIYSMSKTALEQFCKNAKRCGIVGTKASRNDYTSDFEAISSHEKQDSIGVIRLEDTTADEELSKDQSRHETDTEIEITSSDKNNCNKTDDINSSSEIKDAPTEGFSTQSDTGKTLTEHSKMEDSSNISDGINDNTIVDDPPSDKTTCEGRSITNNETEISEKFESNYSDNQPATEISKTETIDELHKFSKASKVETDEIKDSKIYSIEDISNTETSSITKSKTSEDDQIETALETSKSDGFETFSEHTSEAIDDESKKEDIIGKTVQEISNIENGIGLSAFIRIDTNESKQSSITTIEDVHDDEVLEMPSQTSTNSISEDMSKTAAPTCSTSKSSRTNKDVLCTIVDDTSDVKEPDTNSPKSSKIEISEGVTNKTAENTSEIEPETSSQLETNCDSQQTSMKTSEAVKSKSAKDTSDPTSSKLKTHYDSNTTSEVKSKTSEDSSKIGEVQIPTKINTKGDSSEIDELETGSPMPSKIELQSDSIKTTEAAKSQTFEETSIPTKSIKTREGDKDLKTGSLMSSKIKTDKDSIQTLEGVLSKTEETSRIEEIIPSSKQTSIKTNEDVKSITIDNDFEIVSPTTRNSQASIKTSEGFETSKTEQCEIEPFLHSRSCIQTNDEEISNIEEVETQSPIVIKSENKQSSIKTSDSKTVEKTSSYDCENFETLSDITQTNLTDGLDKSKMTEGKLVVLETNALQTLSNIETNESIQSSAKTIECTNSEAVEGSVSYSKHFETTMPTVSKHKTSIEPAGDMKNSQSSKRLDKPKIKYDEFESKTSQHNENSDDTKIQTIEDLRIQTNECQDSSNKSMNENDEILDDTSNIDESLSYDGDSNCFKVTTESKTKTQTDFSKTDKKVIKPKFDNILASELKNEELDKTSDQTDKSVKTLTSEENSHIIDAEINNNKEILDTPLFDHLVTSPKVANKEIKCVDADDENNQSTISLDEEDEKENVSELSFSYGFIDKKVDVKKRVSEILTDANILSPRRDTSPRLQDLYVTAYDVADDDIKGGEVSPVKQINDEVQQLLKKQLEIENEIKKIEQQQQKEQLPYLYVREIPNKPPPPYTPPLAIQASTGSVLPTNEKHLASITTTIASILHTSYLNNSLHNVTLSPEYKHQTAFEFIFDLCKEATIEHYKQYQEETGPSWLHVTKKTKLALGKPFAQKYLDAFLLTKMKQLLGYESIKSVENNKRKWSSRKRDHVDELLVVECQDKEAAWNNYDRDEVAIKDELCKDIMNMLVSETAQVFSSIVNKKTFLY